MYLFVYGTLRKACEPQRHHHLLRHAHYVADGYIFARLYEVDKYPTALQLIASGDYRNYLDTCR